MSGPESYKRELDNITASDEFKQHTKNRLLLALEADETETQSAPTPKRRMPLFGRRAIALACALAVCVVGWRATLPALQSTRGADVQQQEQYTAPSLEPKAEPRVLPEAEGEEPSIPAAPDAPEEKKPSSYFAAGAPVLSSTSQNHVVAGEDAAGGGNDGGASSSTNKPEGGQQGAGAGNEDANGKAADPEPPPITLPEEPPAAGDTVPGEVVVAADSLAPATDGGGDTASTPEELPVYVNAAPHSATQPAGGYSTAQLTDIAREQAAALGLPVLDVQRVPDSAAVVADCDEATIEAYADGAVNIVYNTPVTLDVQLPLEEGSGMDADMLVEQFNELFAGMQDPTADSVARLLPGGKTAWSVYIYDASEEASALTRSLSGARLLLNEEGALTGIQLWRADLFSQLGTYPLLSEAEAVRLLEEGAGTTALPIDFPGKDSLQAISLEYRYTGYEELLLPYYKFYVALPQSDACELPGDGETGYLGVWYLPAIDPAYIE